jgi:hypothetical protein
MIWNAYACPEGRVIPLRQMQPPVYFYPNQGSILQNSISAENFSDKLSSSNFRHKFTQKQQI